MKIVGYTPKDGDKVMILGFSEINGAAFIGQTGTAHYPEGSFELNISFDPPVCVIPPGTTPQMLDDVYAEALKFWETNGIDPEFTREEMGYIPEIWVKGQIELAFVDSSENPPLQ